MKKTVSLILVAVLLFSICFLASCGEKKTTTDGITGTVKYAVRAESVDDATAVAEKFMSVYKGVTVEIVPYDTDLTTFLNNQAAAKTMPDVAYGWDNMTYFLSQDWLYPLDEFLNKDDEKQYIDKNSLTAYTFSGKTYAVPVWMQFTAVMINLDLLDSINEDPPAYDWTLSEFDRLLRKATNDKYSGINHVHALEEYLAPTMGEGLSEYCYNPETKKFELTDAWVKAIEFKQSLQAVAGLVGDELKNSELTDAGQMDSYQKKFGKDADALREGKILFGLHSTWDLGWIETMSYKWDMYPIPQTEDIGFKEGVHSDYGIMFKNAKNPEACYEFLKWISYGKEGILSRFDHYLNKETVDGTAKAEFFIPSSSHPDVVKAFGEIDIVPNGIKYMYEHMDQSYKADYYKVLPDFKAALKPVEEAQKRIANGETAASLAKETEDLVNNMFGESYAAFEAKLK